MDERRLSAEDLARTRFATSPLWETVASLRVLQQPEAAMHAAWAGPVRQRVRDSGPDLSRLLALVPPTGHLADLLTPTPTRRHGDMAAELAAVGEVDLDVIRSDLAYLRAGCTSSAGMVLDEAASDLVGLRERVVEDLRAYWELTVSRVWDRLEGLAESDIAWRLERMSAGGAHAVIDTLHPRVRLDGGDLVVAGVCRPGPITTGYGVVLVPCAFAWPKLLLLDLPGSGPTLSYSPRGVGTLWRAVPDAVDTPLAELVGRTRAAAVLLLDLPMTTGQLAAHLDLSPSAASSHLKILERAGLVTAARRGRRVPYARTGLGDELASTAGTDRAVQPSRQPG